MHTPSPKSVTPGRIVLYCLESGRNKGEYRPAIVVKCWGPEMVQLQVFTDADREGRMNDGIACPYWATSVHHGTGQREWLWPDEVEWDASRPGHIVQHEDLTGEAPT